MLCAEEGAGTEAWGGCCQWPGSAHSWMKRFHVPPRFPPSPPYNRCIHPSPPPICPLQLRIPTWCLQRGQRRHSCTPGTAGLLPHGLPAPWTSSPTDAHAVPAAPPAASLLCALCPMLPVSVPGGQAWPPSPHLTLKAELGIYGQGEPIRGRGRGAGRGSGTTLGGHRSPLCPTAVPLQPLVLVVLYYFVLLSLPPPPPFLPPPSILLPPPL